MIRKIVPAILIFAASLFTGRLEGQSKSGVQDLLIGKLSDYCKAVPWEDVYVHTDRNEYIAGEELWFSTFLIDRLTGTPSSGSKIAYIEILNPANRPVIQKSIKIENGSGPGCITLPDTLTSGKYIIRAYTGFMKNFLPGNCFIKELKIFNALRDRVLKEVVLPVGTSSMNSLKLAGINSQQLLNVDNSKPDSVKIVLNTDATFRSVNKNLCYLLVINHGEASLSKAIGLAGDRTVLVISRKDLVPGINQINIFNASGKPVAERLLYTPVAQNQVAAISAPANVGVREKVTVGVSLAEIPGASETPAILSFSIRYRYRSAGEPGISDFMVFGTEFGILPDKIRNTRLIEMPVSYIDSCLQTFKSSWIDWEKILSPVIPVFKYKLENENNFISGKLINNSTDKPDTSVFVILSSPGKVAGFQYATTDRDGRFTFALPLQESVMDLIIQPIASNRNSIIQMESSFPELYFKSGSSSVPSETTLPSYIRKMSSNYQVGRIYGVINFSFQQVSPRTESKLKNFYGKPDIELIMDDYIKLPVMSEVFFELLPGVFLKSRRSVWELSIADPVVNRVYDEPPVLFIDGVVIDDAAKIANLDPDLVERIDVIKERYLVGDFLFFGLVNVITRAGDLSNITLPNYALRLQYRTTEPARTFAFPDYMTPDMKQRRIPDFRNTMYWNPSVIPGKDGKASVEFWSSDFQGQYVIDIQGITSDGKKISISKDLTVK